MEQDEAYLHTFFNFISQNHYDKAKDHVEKYKHVKKSGPWYMLMMQLSQLVVAEKSYMELEFLQSKIKGFLWKDNSLKCLYESVKGEIKKVEDSCKVHNQEKSVLNYCQNIAQFLSARLQLIDFYEHVYTIGHQKVINYADLVTHITTIIEQNIPLFSDISMTSIKAIFGLECDILSNLFKALVEVQKLQFLPSLVLIHGAHTGLTLWESKIQNRERTFQPWKLGFIKNIQWPPLYQWLSKLKGAVISKFSLYFYHILSQQTTPTDMKQLCSKLQYDSYQKIAYFHKKYDASVLLVSDNQFICVNSENDSFPIIVSYPQKICSNLDMILQMITDVSQDLSINDRIIFKYIVQEHCTYVLCIIEPTVYIVLIFESKRTEKDLYINNFISDLCINLRCSKVFLSLKDSLK
nr:KICSTOR complex protein C12orf66 homolog isoform X1 [Onthophagus taurus]XP_022912491.1 KICSTOR complex protein C12orf66 homolog isoform X1 [Onthophagus taurus]XP_022912493.1 KICSTOR complex protein C12orf66 homolog isoform X2 [Onthophagus taurus]